MESILPKLKEKKLNPIERNKAEKDGLAIGSQIDRFSKLGWEDMNETDLKLRLKWYGVFWRPKTPGKFMLRLRIPNGILSANQMIIISSIVARYGEEGSCDITTRQNIQLRGILISDLPEIFKRLSEAGLSTIQSGFDNPRNITGNPLAGIDPNEIIDTRPYTSSLDNYLTNEGKGNSEFSNLPRKWNTAVAGAKDNFLLHNDIVFHPVTKDGLLGFGVWVGGVLSSVMNAYAVPLNAWIPAKDLCRFTGEVCKLWRDNGERNLRPKGRFRFYIDSIGIETLRTEIENRFGSLEEDPGSIFNEPPRRHYGIHCQKQEGLHYAGIHIPVGRLKAEDLQTFASLSMQYGNGEIRLTEDQNIILIGIPTDKLQDFQSEELFQSFPLEPGAISSGTVSCTGNTYCSFAITNTKDQAMKIAKELDLEIEIPKEIKIHWTGCPNSCGQAYMGAIGLTGAKTRSKKTGEVVEAYHLTVGGDQGAIPQIGTIRQKAIPQDEIKDVIKEILIKEYGAQPKGIPKMNQIKMPLAA